MAAAASPSRWIPPPPPGHSSAETGKKEENISLFFPSSTDVLGADEARGLLLQILTVAPLVRHPGLGRGGLVHRGLFLPC